MKYDKVKGQLLLGSPGDPDDYIGVGPNSYYLQYLNGSDQDTGKGKNSFVFRGIRDDGEEEIIFKFCKYHASRTSTEAVKRRERFIREIQAMERVHQSAAHNIVEFIDSGTRVVDGKKFHYYCMERADGDLAEFLETNEIGLSQRVILCWDILKCLKELHHLGIYHRDIKPDNVFFVGETWKIGDLGFIQFRGEDDDISDPTDRIGPTGLMSPEAVDRALANRSDSTCTADFLIDDKSDIFQVGYLFWYILQGNIPTGQVHLEDLGCRHEGLYNSVLLPMIQHSKVRRPEILVIQEAFKPILRDFAS